MDYVPLVSNRHNPVRVLDHGDAYDGKDFARSPLRQN